MADDKHFTGEAGATQGKGGCGCQMSPEPVFPKVTFSTFVLSLASTALVHLGEVPDPSTGESVVNLPAAKHTVDILAMLNEMGINTVETEEVEHEGEEEKPEEEEVRILKIPACKIEKLL